VQGRLNDKEKEKRRGRKRKKRVELFRKNVGRTGGIF
jgi:hypothetical protein